VQPNVAVVLFGAIILGKYTRVQLAGTILLFLQGDAKVYPCADPEPDAFSTIPDAWNVY
jgi:hypothetical protein